MTATLLGIPGYPLFERLGWTLVHSVWQCAVIALVLAMVLTVVRRSVSVRYVAACLALLAAMVIPMITFFVIQPKPETAASVAFVSMSWTSADAQQFQPSRSEKPVESLSRFLPLAALIWAIGVIVLSTLQFGGWVSLRKLRRNSTLIEAAEWIGCVERLRRQLGIDRAIVLVESALVEVPSLVGWLRPMILLPCSALAGLNPDQLEALLAHELAHVRRNDYLVNLIQVVIETLLFYHLAAWWISRVIRQERENCCDDLAVQVIGNRKAYGAALMAMEELRSSRPAFALAATGGSLPERIKRLLAPQPPRASLGWPVVLTLAVIIGLSVCSRFMDDSAKAQKTPGSTTAPATGASRDSVPTQDAHEHTRALLLKYVEKLRERVAELEVDLTEARTKDPSPSPILSEKQNALDALKIRLTEYEREIVLFDAASERQTKVYYIAGLPRDGVYELLADKPVTLKSAIATAGGIPNGAEIKQFLIMHADGNNREMISALDATTGGEGALPIRAGDMIMLTYAAPAAEKAEYFIGGHAPRTGVFSWIKNLNLLQALIAAGVNPATADGQVVEIVNRDKTRYSYRIMDLINGNLVNVEVLPEDQIMVKDAPAARPATSTSDQGGLPTYQGTIIKEGSGAIPSNPAAHDPFFAVRHQELEVLSNAYTRAQLETIELSATYAKDNPILARSREKEQALYKAYNDKLKEVMRQNAPQTQP